MVVCAVDKAGVILPHQSTPLSFEPFSLLLPVCSLPLLFSGMLAPSASSLILLGVTVC